MTKFMLGVAVGYVFSDIIDELLGKTKKAVDKIEVPEPPTPEPEGPSPMTSQS